MCFPAAGSSSRSTSSWLTRYEACESLGLSFPDHRGSSQRSDQATPNTDLKWQVGLASVFEVPLQIVALRVYSAGNGRKWPIIKTVELSAGITSAIPHRTRARVLLLRRPGHAGATKFRPDYAGGFFRPG
jgi:hypothetical protein